MTDNLLRTTENISSELEGSCALEVACLSKSFGQVRALSEISLRVKQKEIYGLLGPNGAGKSTFVSILCGLLRPDSGSVTISGIDALANRSETKRLIGIVPQELALYSELSSSDNLLFFGRLYGLSAASLRKRVDQLLEQLQLSERANEPVSGLSGGMQRRLNIAAALVHSPQIVLMDEPTVGLDPQNRRNVLELVQQIAATGATVLYTTHYLDEVESICSRIGIIDHGRLLIEGTLPQLRTSTGGADILALRGSFDAARVRALIALQPAEKLLKCTEDEIVAEMVDGAGRLTSLLAAVSQAGEVREVSIARQSLESLFIQLTGREPRE